MQRRQFILSTGALALGGSIAAPSRAAGRGAIHDLASAALRRAADSSVKSDMVAVADFTAPSSARRFHLVDMASGAVESFLVAHGRGSDPLHTGRLQRFSNEAGSYCTSEGLYRTLGYYHGAHGRSMRLAGLEATNSRAESRAIVVHAATYVSADLANATGRLGRSEGCFAVAEADLARVLVRLGPDRLILAGRFAL